MMWEVVKGFDFIYQNTKQDSEDSANTGISNSYIYKMEHHPGPTYHLEKIEK